MALQLSAEINDNEMQCNNEYGSIFDKQRISEPSVDSTSRDNKPCEIIDASDFSPDVNELEPVQVRSEANDHRLQPVSAGESALSYSDSIDSTCKETDGPRSLSPNHIDTIDKIQLNLSFQISTLNGKCLKHKQENNAFEYTHFSHDESVSTQCCQKGSESTQCPQFENEISQPTEGELPDNLKSVDLLAGKEIKGDSNYTHLPGSFTASEQCNLLETPHIDCPESHLANPQALQPVNTISPPFGGDIVFPDCNTVDQSAIEIGLVTSDDPTVQIRSIHTMSNDQDVICLTNLQVDSHVPVVLGSSYTSTDEPMESYISTDDRTQGCIESNFQGTSARIGDSTQGQNEYDFNTQMGDRVLPLNSSENTLHAALSRYDAGDQIKTDSTSINMNENLKGAQINDLSSYEDRSGDPSIVYPSESAREQNRSRDMYFKQSNDSASSGVIEMNNHITNQDFFQDQVSLLSAEEHSTPKSSCNRSEYSPGSVETQNFKLRDEKYITCTGYERQLTPADDVDTCTCGPKPLNNSRLFECRHGDRIKSEFHINSSNYDGRLGTLQKAEEECCAICFESLDNVELEQLYDDCGFTQGAEIIRYSANEPKIQKSVLNIFREENYIFEHEQDTRLHDISNIGEKPSSQLSPGGGLQERKIKSGSVELCKPGGLDNVNTDIHLEGDTFLNDSSIVSDNNEFQTDFTECCDSQETSRSDSEDRSSDFSTQIYNIESESELDISPTDLQYSSLQSDESAGHCISLDYDKIYPGVVCQTDGVDQPRGRFRKTSIDLDELCQRTAEILNRDEPINVTRSETFESETESGESVSTESGSNNTAEVEYSTSSIPANAGEALCESLSPTEVASILDDTSDSYVDATETFEYETDGELNTVTTSILHTSKDKRRSGDYSLRNVCESTSTESFQDAVETFDDGRHLLIRTNDVTLRASKLEDEDSLSQISLPLSDTTSGSSSSLENLTILGELSDSSCRGETTDNDEMESNGRPRVSTFRSHTVSRTSVKHVHTSDHRVTKSVLKDNLYRGVAGSSQHKDSLPQVGTNVLRSTDTECESGNQIIKNVIYNTGSRIFHSKKFTQHQTGANYATSVFHSRPVKGGENGALGEDGCNVNLDSLICDEQTENGIQSDSDQSDTFGQTSLPSDQMIESSESAESLVLSVSPTPRATESMSVSDGVKSPCDVNIGLKIETAMSIRTERRRMRRRQVQKQVTESSSSTVKSTSEQIVKSDTQSISQECTDGLKRDNVVIYDSPKIPYENSSHITHETCTVNSSGEASNRRDEYGDIITCKQKVGQSVSVSEISVERSELQVSEQVSEVSPVIHALQDQIVETPTFRDEIIVNEHGIIQRAQSEEKLCDESYQSTENTETCCRVNNSASVENDKTEKEADTQLKEKTYTFYIKSGKDADFDDIQFIDDEGDATSEACHTDVKKVHAIEISKDQTPQGPVISSPNASFTIEYSGDEDNTADHMANENIQSTINVLESKDNAASKVKEETAVNKSKEVPIERADKIDKDIVGSVDLTYSPSQIDVSVDSTSNPNIGTVAHKDNSTPVNQESTNQLSVSQAESMGDKSDSVDFERSASIGSVTQIDSEECNSEIVEESHISVKEALKMERQNLNSLRRGSRGNVVRAQNEEYAHSNTVRKSRSSELSYEVKKEKQVIKKSLSFRTEKDRAAEFEDPSLANKRVSDICRSFIDKVRPVEKPTHDRESKSPVRQRKLMKWVRGNGKWLRIPVSEADDETDKAKGTEKLDYVQFSSELNTPTEERSISTDDTLQTDVTDADTNIDMKELSRLTNQETGAVIGGNKEIISCDNKSEIATNVPVNTNMPVEKTPEVIINDFSDERIADELALPLADKPACHQDTIPASTNNQVSEIDSVTDTTDLTILPYKPLSANKDELDIGKPASTTIANKIEPCVQPDMNNIDKEIEGVNVVVCDKDKESSDAKSDIDIDKNKVEHRQHHESAKSINAPVDSISTLSDEECEPVELADVTETVSDARLQRQELLFGIRDNYNRRKNKKTRPESKSIVQKDSVDINDNKDKESKPDGKEASDKVYDKSTEDLSIVKPDATKAIPKLKAVKIQEEIFEGKPEYMKECNKKPSWSVSDVATDSIKRRLETKLRSNVQIRKSKTFSGMGDFEHRTREFLYMTIATSRPSVNSSSDSLDIPQPEQPAKAKSAEDITESNDKDTTSDSQKEYTSSDQGGAKVPWYAHVSRRSRDKKQATCDTTTTGDSTTASAPAKTEKKRLKLPVFSRAKSLTRRKVGLFGVV